MDLNRALQKQIQKFLPEELRYDERMIPFYQSISNLYSTYEKDKKLSEHAFEISEKEYQKVLNDLKEQEKILKNSIKRINTLIQSLDKKDKLNSIENEYDITEIISYLETKVEESIQLEEMLTKAKALAENSAKAKANFLSVMSHEIRTPLNAIIGSIHLLQQEETLPEQSEYLNSLHISSDNLLNLINDVLDYNKIEEGKIEFAKNEIDLHILLKNIKLSNFFKATEYHNEIIINVDKNISDFVYGDETRLSQILNNLVSNAIKFTKNGIITVNLIAEYQSKKNISIKFEISDTGIGIESNKIQQIFERFTQADSNINRKFGGSGLGLTIVKKLLELQNSEIKVKSEFGIGTTFYFTLLFEKSNNKLADIKIKLADEIKDLNSMKVLLVEDNKINTIIAKKMLQNWNAKVTWAENGEIAIQKYFESEFDIILMDLHMPIMDGLTATLKIREKDEKIPIIALTASALFDIKDNVKDSGMNDYISKPFNPDEFYNILKKYL
ncbi:MAG: hypothetical protein RLZZ175_914 [Bacteroidota bacterium]|jgi:signal transduction histidine kinase/CheY-like chemotaxis protein